MEFSGIIRRIDDLGRIVIPKEIRKKIKLNEGEQVEIKLDSEDRVIINKYLPLGNKFEALKDLAMTLSKSLGFKVIITDNEKVVIDSSKNRDLINENISIDVMNIMKNRQQYISKDINGMKCLIERKDINAIGIFPILVEADCIGSIIILPSISNRIIELEDINLIKFVLNFMDKNI